MKIRHVSVKNFRGIQQLEWNVGADVVCLIGPGDATKSTVLDAIAYALSPKWFLGLNDADFFAADTSEPIVIEVTVTHPPRHLLTETKYALLQRGWSAEHGLSDDPDPVGDAALTVRLTVDDALEPHSFGVERRGGCSRIGPGDATEHGLRRYRVRSGSWA